MNLAGAGTGGTGTGGADNTGGSSPGTGGTATGNPKGGRVVFAQRGGGFADPQILVASFWNSETANPACETTVFEGCRIRICPDLTDEPTMPRPDAGTVTFTSTEVPGTATATPDDAGTYVSTADFMMSFGGDEKGTIQATGGDVPAFSQAVQMPLVLLLSQPAFEAGASQTVPRSSDLALSWSRGGENITLHVEAYSDRLDGQPGSVSLVCDLESAPGAGTISAAALQNLESGTMLNFYTAKHAEVMAGDYDVALLTVMGVRDPTKTVSINPTVE